MRVIKQAINILSIDVVGVVEHFTKEICHFFKVPIVFGEDFVRFLELQVTVFPSPLLCCLCRKTVLNQGFTTVGLYCISSKRTVLNFVIW